MTKNFSELKNANPEELGIERQYCLNLTSLDYQEEILNKELKESELNIKNKRKNTFSKSLEENEPELEKKKIEIILEIVKENKKKCPKFGDRELEETKVNLNYEENFSLIINDNVMQEESNNANIIFNKALGTNRVSLLPRNELYGDNNLNESSKIKNLIQP